VEECGPCPVFASFNLAFALQLRKKYGKTSVTVRKTSVRLRKTSVRVRKTSVRVRKTSVRVRKTSVRLRKTCQGKKNLSQVKKNLSHSTVYILPKTPTHYKTLTNTHITKTHSYTHMHTRIHTLQNNIKPPQNKLKRNAYRKSKST